MARLNQDELKTSKFDYCIVVLGLNSSRVLFETKPEIIIIAQMVMLDNPVSNKDVQSRPLFAGLVLLQMETGVPG